MKSKTRILDVKTLALALMMALMTLGFVGCEDDDEVWDPIPATPQGVFSITGDGVVWIYFNGIYERDVAQYIVYRSLNATTGYVEIGRVNAVSNPDLDLLIYEYPDQTANNGTTYFYAVASIDRSGQVSALSAENVFDTPRPEGTTSLFPNDVAPELSGFNFETGSPVDWQSVVADVFVDSVGGTHYLNAANDSVYIQDMGFTYSFDDIGWSPTDGWLQLLYVELALGHTYVVRTETTTDYYYAKIRAVSHNASGSWTFDWAWQSDPNNPELLPKPEDVQPTSEIEVIANNGRSAAGL